MLASRLVWEILYQVRSYLNKLNLTVWCFKHEHKGMFNCCCCAFLLRVNKWSQLVSVSSIKLRHFPSPISLFLFSYLSCYSCKSKQAREFIYVSAWLYLCKHVLSIRFGPLLNHQNNWFCYSTLDWWYKIEKSLFSICEAVLSRILIREAS